MEIKPTAMINSGTRIREEVEDESRYRRQENQRKRGGGKKEAPGEERSEGPGEKAAKPSRFFVLYD